MSKIEEVAKAIQDKVESGFTTYEEAARAAIEAMRDPSHDLTWAAVQSVHEFAVSHDVEFYRFHGILAPDAQRLYQERIAVAFNSIIDAALSEERAGE